MKGGEVELNDKLVKFSSTIENYEKVNPSFAKVKIRIMYEGGNRNRSRFSREVIESMIPTLYNIPVVGEWKENDEDFGSHGGKVEMSDDGIKFIDTTRPYGVVPSDTEITWEKVKEKNGIDEREYLCCTAYLWVGRYPELERIYDNECNQSMEIIVEDGIYSDDGYFDVKKAYFSALCILGEDVEPCFESANVERYSFDKYKAEFNLMLKELKESFEQEEEQQMEDEKNLQIEETQVEEAIENEVVETIEETKEDCELEEIVVESTEEEVVEQEPQMNYEAEYNKLLTEVETYKSTIEILNAQLEENKGSYDLLLAEKEELSQYKEAKENEIRMAKVKAKVEEVVKDFNVQDEEKFNELVNKALNEEIDIETLKFNLFALVGMEKTSMKSNAKEDKPIVKVFQVTEKEIHEPYGALSKYFQK